MAWTNATTAMSGPKPKPPTLRMAWALFFVQPHALTTWSVIILLATTFNVLIAPPLSMILISTTSQMSPLPLVGPYLWGPFLFAQSIRSHPIALPHAMPESSMSTAILPLNVPAFIWATIATPSRPATAEIAAGSLTP